ncbi:hypothetical protein L6E12_26510 [Actinokineospora sp. PR83]|uniref:hypothetical protein n=1 Tax=Actinokineospora sp. PR83 TaxID=2884908 RepID=UPI001F3139E5|nr:hypothetical protein [Actinokineospora sp. PR83]MCG8919332.1 hypothetical protein [Actinokineospora sp. PR83]
MADVRVILDTNLWSSIGDEGVVDEFTRLMAAHSLRVLMPPSILMEVLRMPASAAEARGRIVHALVRGSRHRLSTEAESEAAEVVAEVKRLRPAWLRAMPDTARVASLHGFWTKAIWRQASRDSSPLHRYEVANTQKHDHVIATQKRQRSLFLQDKAPLRPLTGLMVHEAADAGRHLPGWDGRPVEPWRVAARAFHWYELVQVTARALLTREDTTTADWVGAHVDLARLRADPEDFTRFWLQDVRVDALRRQWVRWAVNLLQADQKITKGNPADEQHCSYLVDCDLFLSADARCVAVFEIVNEDAPFPVARPVLVSGDRGVPVLERIARVL